MRNISRDKVKRLTVEDGMTPVQAHFVLEHFFSLSSICILDVQSCGVSHETRIMIDTYARVGNPAVGLHQGGRSEILVLVPPIRGTAGRATGAENTLVETVEFLAIFW